MIYLLSEKRLKADFLNDNIDSSLILPSIQTAQDIYLRQTLGDSLLDKICNLVRDNELDEPYKTLLDEYIIIYLEYLAMAELCVPSTFKLGNIGIAQAYDSNVNTQTIQNVKYLESYYKQKASFYENRLTTFIQQHCNLYPEYRDTTTVTTAQESTLQCGIYLGGTTTRKKIINNNTNNNTEVGNYVRYDKAQNLSELEKAQARENIGVSASGDIVVDLENYYTKSEVFNKTEIDTKLIPYITTNEVNLRLNSYYDKSQVDNAIETAIDNIEIPDVDLENYYTKEEVDNLVANSGGGSDTPTNVPIVDIMSLNYDEQIELINYVIDNNRFADLNTLYTYRGYVLNNLPTEIDWWNEENGERYVIFSLYAHPKSYDIRFITYDNGWGEIYNDILEKDESESLTTNYDVDVKLDTLSNSLVLDLSNYDNDELLHIYNYLKSGSTYTEKPIAYRGKYINNITIEGENVRFWHYGITTEDSLVNSDTTFYVDVELYDVEMGLVRTTHTEIGGCTIIGGNNSGGTTDLSNYYNKQEVDTLIAEIPTFSGNYNDLTNKPSVDIMTLPYSEQYNVLQYLVDNNVLPYTVTYNGVVLNNLPIEISWWDEEQNQRQIIFSVYGVQSYNIRFITYEWYENVIYNDTHAKEETDNLVKKGEVDERFNNLNIPTLATVATSGDYNDLTNTPTIPTATSQLQLDNVYNKSEIDSMIGNINNILNEI